MVVVEDMDGKVLGVSNAGGKGIAVDDGVSSIVVVVESIGGSDVVVGNADGMIITVTDVAGSVLVVAESVIVVNVVDVISSSDDCVEEVYAGVLDRRSMEDDGLAFPVA